MRMSLAPAVAVLAGSLLLPVLMLGSAQAVTSAPDLKNAIGSGTVTLTPVRGGGFAGGGGQMGGFAVRTSMVDPDLPVGSSITLVIGTS